MFRRRAVGSCHHTGQNAEDTYFDVRASGAGPKPFDMGGVSSTLNPRPCMSPLSTENLHVVSIPFGGFRVWGCMSFSDHMLVVQPWSFLGSP